MNSIEDANTFEGALDRVLNSVRKQNAELETFLRSQPPDLLCAVHPEVRRQLTLEATTEETRRRNGTLTAGYAPCPRCVEDRTEQLLQHQLRDQGVPSTLLQCTLDNWTPTSIEDKAAIANARLFATEIRRGFLVLLGEIGTGKSHLAAGVLRHFRNGLFIKQNTLLRMLRQTYRDQQAKDPVERCQEAGLLVLDEIGLSSGGRDELPMLHEVLDYRHCERRPTVITGNVTWEELKDCLGERLADRLRESAFRVVTLAGRSHRGEEVRKRYFGPRSSG